MKILVAGGAGYIGSALVPALIENDYDVDVIDTFWFGDFLPDTVHKIKKDLFDCTKEELAQYDQVIFVAGLSNDPMAEYDPVRNFIYNGSLPAFLAFLAKRAGVKRFIYASTCSVYGYTVNQLFNEESKISCNYPYGISKHQGEKGAMHIQDENFSVICLRKGTVSGVSPRMRFDLIVNTMTKCALTEGAITVNNPSIWRPIIDIRDTVSAYLCAIQAEQEISGVFNIMGDNYTVGDVANSVKSELEALPDKNINIDMKNVHDLRNYKVSIEKARTILGFNPKYTITDTVKDIYSHWPEYEKNINDKKYYNIQICKELFPTKINWDKWVTEK